LLAVEDQIEDAEYFLQRLRASSSRKEMRANLGAFLAASRSIADHLLEDYNLKFALNIPLDEKLTYKKFKEEAINKKDKTALAFLIFYKNEFNKLKQDKKGQYNIGKLLLEKRNIKIHRKEIPVRADFFRSITEQIHISESVSIVVTDKNGNIKQQSTSQQENAREDKNLLQKKDNEPQEYTEPVNDKAGVNWYFVDYQQKELLEICDDFLKMMKAFVKRVQSKFP
jgi:hypothetical protein